MKKIEILDIELLRDGCNGKSERTLRVYLGKKTFEWYVKTVNDDGSDYFFMGMGYCEDVSSYVITEGVDENDERYYVFIIYFKHGAKIELEISMSDIPAYSVIGRGLLYLMRSGVFDSAFYNYLVKKNFVKESV